MLLDAGADIDACLPSNDRPLHVALSNEKEDVTLFLVQRGADIAARGSKNETGLLCAAEFDAPRALQVLLDKGLSTEDVDEDSYSALCLSGSRQITEILLKHGADVHYQDRNGWTALHHAVCNRDFDIAQELLMAGADADVKTEDDGFDVFNRIDDIEDEWERMTFIRVLEKVHALKRKKTEADANSKAKEEVESGDIDDDLEMVDRSECVS
jgi:ankyrin repeat protein